MKFMFILLLSIGAVGLLFAMNRNVLNSSSMGVIIKREPAEGHISSESDGDSEPEYDFTIDENEIDSGYESEELFADVYVEDGKLIIIEKDKEKSSE